MDTKDMTFVQQEIDGAYINSLVRLVNACNLMGVELDKVSFYQNGFRVTFKGYDGADAICHDGSYGSPCYMARYNGKGHDPYSFLSMSLPASAPSLEANTLS